MSSESEEYDDEESITQLFDSLCVSFGDNDAIIRLPAQGKIPSADPVTPSTVSYIELQETSRCLAFQLCYRYRPDYVLIDCFGHAAAEATAVLACVRLGIPFVPVSVVDLHSGGRLKNVVKCLLRSKEEGAAVVAVCCVPNDMDPRLGIFFQANVHRILFVNSIGILQEQLPVPKQLPSSKSQFSDELYVLFTSGTSGDNPKAVVGSHRSTYRRLAWFRNQFRPSPLIARRTPLTFVDGVTELLTALLQESSLLLALEEPELLNERGLAVFWEYTYDDDADCYHPTQITLLPSQLEQLLLTDAATQNDRMLSLERILVSGEPFTERLYTTARKTWPQCEILNLYGQTESTGDVLYAVLTKMEPQEAVVDGIVAVGQPILPCIQCHMAPLNDGTDDKCSGELIVSGNLALGYLRPFDEKAAGIATRFTSINTGDVAFCKKSDKGHSIWYMRGRKDDVEKISGIWTSPSEVEVAFAGFFELKCRVAAIVIDGAVYIVLPPDAGMRRLDFNREKMHEAGIPWNLIPMRVFYHEIPINTAGTGKVSRSSLRSIVQRLLEEDFGRAAPSAEKQDVLLELVGKVLKIREVDETKSFANLGGNSASSISLLYHLRQSRKAKSVDLTAADILLAENMKELRELISGTSPRKRRRLEQKRLLEPSFRPYPPQYFSEKHMLIQFRACVDASPVLDTFCEDTMFYVGCQGGVLLRISAKSGQVISYRDFAGWMIQADCLVLANSVIVSTYKVNSTKSAVVALDKNLNIIKWKKQVDSSVKATPILINGTLLIQAGNTIFSCDPGTGKEISAAVKLPARVIASAAVLPLDGGTAYYASAGWDCSQIMTFKEGATSVSLMQPTGTALGLVYKDPVIVDPRNILIADLSGSLHLINVETSNSVSYHVANSALSPPAVLIGAKNEMSFVVGSYEGIVFCLQADDRRNELVLEWELSVGAAIYAKPLVLPDNETILVTTTAGDVITILKGQVINRYRIAAEIWSCATLLGGTGERCRIAFGARDSRVHILDIPW